MTARLFLATSRPRYDLSWAIRKPGYGSLAEVLSFAAQSCLLGKKRYYIHELVSEPRGWLWWRRLHTQWVPRYYVEPSDNTVRSLERWGIFDVPSVTKVSDPDGYTALEDGRVVVVRRNGHRRDGRPGAETERGLADGRGDRRGGGGVSRRPSLLVRAWEGAQRDVAKISERQRKIFDANDELRRRVDNPERCGLDCSCCEYGDGTAPCDHDRECELRTAAEDPVCSCEGSEDRAQKRKESA